MVYGTWAEAATWRRLRPWPRLKRMTSRIFRMAVWGRVTGSFSDVVVDCPCRLSVTSHFTPVLLRLSYRRGVRKPRNRCTTSLETDVQKLESRHCAGTSAGSSGLYVFAVKSRHPHTRTSSCAFAIGQIFCTQFRPANSRRTQKPWSGAPPAGFETASQPFSDRGADLR